MHWAALGLIGQEAGKAPSVIGLLTTRRASPWPSTCTRGTPPIGPRAGEVQTLRPGVG